MSKVRLDFELRWLFLLLSPDKASPLHSRGGHWPRCILYLFPCHPSRFIPCYSYKHRPTRLQASHPFLRHKMPTPKNDPNNQEHPTDLLYQNRSFSYEHNALANRKSSGLDYKIHNSHLCPVPPLFFGQARLPLPQGFDGSEQYFWICDGSCGAFYLDDFISDFTGQRAYAIWNGIAFLAGSNIFCHSSKSLLLGQPKTLFHAIGT